jgi:hypothetical protein
MRSNHVTLHKKGGNQHKIPYAIGLTYQHPPVDNVASEYWVEVLNEDDAIKTIETVEQAIEVYLQAFRQKFQSQENRKQRRICLQYFQRYLVEQGHSMKLKDLTLFDGQGYIGSVVNQYNGLPLSDAQMRKYRSALRSFSRFLHDLGALEANVFLPLAKR